MKLNSIWISFFLIAFLVAVCKLIYLFCTFGATGLCLEKVNLLYGTIVNSTFDSAKIGFELSLALTGTLSLWMGLMKIGEDGGMIQVLSRLVNPLFKRLFPDIPKGHPAAASILMNLSANLLGLDNAATPAGLQAMKELQTLNPEKHKASNPMIMFLVLNASGLTLIPVSVMTLRAAAHAKNPTDVFVPIMIATFVATLVGVLAVCIKQRINIFDRIILGTGLAVGLLIAAVVYVFKELGQEKGQLIASIFANGLIFSIMIGFIISAIRKKVNVYDSFIEGAKNGFSTAIHIIPYLVAILVAVGVFRASGAMDTLIAGIKWLVELTGCDTRWVDALPTALMKPLSGTGARGLMVDAMNTSGVDSFVGRLAGTFQGATDTTFYLVAVYYGCINIKNSRYTVSYALLADLAGVITAILVSYMFFS